MVKADKYYSLYVRLFHSDAACYCRCVTCGNRKHYKQMQLGHWRRRGFQPTRYDERNTGPQCIRCNKYKSGEPEIFEEYIRRKYGEKVVEELRVKSLMRAGRKKIHFEQIAREYHGKWKIIKKQRSI